MHPQQDGHSIRQNDGAHLALIIRFSASIPDLALEISSPQTTTTATLSTLIRPTLPRDLSSCALRYIASGALIEPNVSLCSALRLGRGTPAQKFYVHCSISASAQLSVAELAAEAKAARNLSNPSSGLPQTPRLSEEAQASRSEEPQGFDRLIAAGFTPTEVASLRSHFLAIQSHTHTPDTMPTGAELRLLEERWLDTNNANGPDPPGDAEGGSSGGLEDMLWGNVMGFFWAFGALVWLLREEGVWSKRRQIGVLTGVLVNVLFCVLRAGG